MSLILLTAVWLPLQPTMKCGIENTARQLVSCARHAHKQQAIRAMSIDRVGGTLEATVCVCVCANRAALSAHLGTAVDEHELVLENEKAALPVAGARGALDDAAARLREDHVGIDFGVGAEVRLANVEDGDGNVAGLGVHLQPD